METIKYGKIWKHHGNNINKIMSYDMETIHLNG